MQPCPSGVLRLSCCELASPHGTACLTTSDTGSCSGLRRGAYRSASLRATVTVARLSGRCIQSISAAVVLSAQQSTPETESAGSQQPMQRQVNQMHFITGCYTSRDTRVQTKLAWLWAVYSVLLVRAAASYSYYIKMHNWREYKP